MDKASPRCKILKAKLDNSPVLNSMNIKVPLNNTKKKNVSVMEYLLGLKKTLLRNLSVVLLGNLNINKGIINKPKTITILKIS